MQVMQHSFFQKIERGGTYHVMNMANRAYIMELTIWSWILKHGYRESFSTCQKV
jgi:hypothetical protein